jgi:hypothetical protein
LSGAVPAAPPVAPFAIRWGGLTKITAVRLLQLTGGRAHEGPLWVERRSSARAVQLVLETMEQRGTRQGVGGRIAR